MTKSAKIENGTVTNIIIGNQPDHIEISENENVGIGWTYVDGVFVAPPAPALTVSDFEQAIQAHVDQTAKDRLYADGVTLASYVNSTNAQWAAEATTFVAWRDGVWGHAYTALAEVQAGARETPTIEGLLDELPVISWPE